ncbi:LLM class flavin-dependent oxidoreductase [Actinomadura chokoriensis]|uniref:LLM class flavin-dependent oxidoreductase n=1 Tax=Actinomadura chokoriensis TaxID=454156 RepID=A0ABV4R3S4_9ACTN
MRFGLFYEHQLPRPWSDGQELKLYQDALDQVEIADRVGFDYIWEVEHHFLEEYSHSSAPEVFLAAASQRTKRIRLGHGIVQLPPAVNHPARIAERIATLDLVSNGRVDFGTGESSSSAELGGFGVRRTEKRDQWQDAIDAITRMFVEEPFAGWSSKYVQMPPRNVLPKTVQKPHPPLWVACSRRETIQFAARNGIGALSFSFVEPEDAGKWVDEYYRILASDECVPAGFAVNPNLCVVLPMMLHEDEATAIERGIDGAHFFAFALAHYYGPTPHDPGRTNVWEEFQERRDARGFAREQIIANAKTLNVNVGSLRGAVGTPEQVIDLIRRYESVGVDQIAFVLQSGPNKHEHICESLELLGKAVLPHFIEGREEREAAKADRLAPAIEAALARRAPARKAPTGYRINEDAEVARSHRSRRPLRGDIRAASRRRFRQNFYKVVHGRSDEQIERRFGPSAQRLFFAGMARAFDPSAAGGFTGELEFRLTRTSWTLVIGERRARARPGPAGNPSLTLIVKTADFLRILAGDANPAALLMDGRLELRGEFDLAPRLSEMFGGPSPY